MTFKLVLKKMASKKVTWLLFQRLSLNLFFSCPLSLGLRLLEEPFLNPCYPFSVVRDWWLACTLFLRGAIPTLRDAWETSTGRKFLRKQRYKIMNYSFYYSPSCVQRPPLGPKICGRCWQVVVVQRQLYVIKT